jgi:hypothetical protein
MIDSVGMRRERCEGVPDPAFAGAAKETNVF